MSHRIVVDTPCQTETADANLELIELVWIISQSVIIRHIVEELLCIQCSSQEQRQAPVGRLDNVADFVNSLAAIKRIYVREPVFGAYS